MLVVNCPPEVHCAILKIYQCMNCHAVFRTEADRDAHASSDKDHQKMREYELEEFLTRFIVAA